MVAAGGTIVGGWRLGYDGAQMLDIQRGRARLRIARQRGNRGRPQGACRRPCRARAARRRGSASQTSLTEARAQAEKLLLKDRHGRRCAERLCGTQDEIIRILFEFAAEANFIRRRRAPRRAHGGDRDRRLWPRAVGAGLRHRSPVLSCPTSKPPGESRSPKTLLYCLWDMGQKVGHATRSVSECIRQAKADMTIRTALLESRHLFGDAKLYAELNARFEKEVVQGTAAEFVAAKLAEREERHRRAGQSRYLVEPNVKDGKGGLRDLHTLFWIAKYVYRVARARGTDRLRRIRSRRIQSVSPLRGFPLVGPLQHAFPLRPRGGAAFVRHPARYRGAARLHRASRAARTSSVS